MEHESTTRLNKKCNINYRWRKIQKNFIESVKIKVQKVAASSGQYKITKRSELKHMELRGIPETTCTIDDQLTDYWHILSI